jgi:hypothetical protein
MSTTRPDKVIYRLITTTHFPEESYWVWCVWVWLRTSTVEGLKQLGLSIPPQGIYIRWTQMIEILIAYFSPFSHFFVTSSRPKYSSQILFSDTLPFIRRHFCSNWTVWRLVTCLVRLPALTVRPGGTACRRVTSNPFSDTLHYILFCKVRINFHPDIKQRVKLCFVCMYVCMATDGGYRDLLWYIWKL